MDQKIEQVIARAEENEFKKFYRKDRIGGVFKIVKYFLDKYHIKTIGGKHDRELFIYSDGVYIPGENKIRREIQELLEDLSSNHYKKEIIDKIKDTTVAERKDFEVDKNIVNLGNGIFNIETGELLTHDPNLVFFYKIPVNLVKEADCPLIKKFLSEILDESDIEIIQEWFGYGLYRSYFIKKAIIFVGEGDTGKTTLLRVLERFIGKENVSGVSLQKISSDKFSAAQFYNKHLNLYDDLSFKDINDNGAFKIATGGGSITGEYKYGDQFQFENFSKLTFACNKIPDIKDTNDPAYFNRWMIIHFRKEIENPDKFLIDKIITPEELSGLLNFALAGLKRLLLNQNFSYKKEPHEIKIEMERSGSVIAQFTHDRLEEAQGEWMDKQTLYILFAQYARAKHLPVATIEEVGRKLRNYADYIINSKQNKITGWRNVKIKGEPAPIEELEKDIKAEELF